MEALRALVCPACGGQMGVPEHGVARCPFCNGRALLYQGGLRKVGVYRLEPAADEPTCRGLVERALRNAGFATAPVLEVTEGTVRFLLRRGRVRVRGEGAREGLFGVPWGGGPGGVLFLADPGALVPSDAAVPDDLPSELLGFEDHLLTTLPRDRRVRSGEASSVEIEHTSWSDDLYVVDVPVWRFGFEARALRNSVLRAWSDLRPDGRYAVVVDRAAGALLSFEAPSNGVNVVTLLVGFVALVTLPGLLGAGLGFLGALLGVVVSVLDR